MKTPALLALMKKKYQVAHSFRAEELELDNNIKEKQIVQIKFCSKQNLLFVLTLGTLTRCKVSQTDMSIDSQSVRIRYTKKYYKDVSINENRNELIVL